MTFAGTYTPIVTPFTPGGDLDAAGLAANVQRYMRSSLTGLVVLGSNGEAPQLDDYEADRAIAAARDHVPAGKPLLAGTGRESTRATIAATRRAAALGVDGVLVRTPAFYKSQMTSEIFVRHYTEVADASPVPVLLYNVTMYTGVNLLPDAVATLSEHPNIVGMKESGNDMVQFAEYLGRATDGFVVLAGSAATYYSALALGAHGAVLALAGVAPDQCTEIGRLVATGSFAEARALARRLMPLARSIGATYGVAGLKAALDLAGYHGGPPRPPLRPAPPAAVEIIRGQLASLGLLQETTDAARQ
ncbi:MAG: dihydrodipicolinate synthase family protein [Vicinamibacterales bacterium]